MSTREKKLECFENVCVVLDFVRMLAKMPVIWEEKNIFKVCHKFR
jgi:hypothetical protein